MSRHGLRASAVALGVLAMTTGCGRAGPEPVEPPLIAAGAAGAAARDACTALDPALPAVLDGHKSRRTEPESALTAAWDDPAIVLRCGVGTPGELRPTSQLYTVNDVDWFPVESEDGWRFTTVGRVANIEVLVPNRYQPAVNPLVDLAAPILATIPPT